MKLYNIVKVYTSTTGTGTVTLGSALPSFITFATAAVINGSTVSYAIEDGSNREVGTGVYTSGAETLTRNVVTSTNANNLITLSGNAVVFTTGLAADLSSDTAATANTLVIRDGSGNFALGTPTSGTLTNATGLPISTGVSGLGTGVATFLATPSSANLASAVTDETGTGALVFATSPTLVTPLLGTPTSGTLTSCTGLPISTGVSGLGASVATFLATPSSANLAAAVTDETGTGSLVFATSPTIATPTVTTSAVIPLVNGGTAVSSTLTLQSTSGAGSSDAIVFKTASQSERMRITTAGDVNIGGGTNAGDTLRYFDLYNTNTGSSAGSIVRIITSDAAGTGTVVAQIVKYKNGTMLIQNSETSATGNMLFYVGVSERMRIDNAGNVGIGLASPQAALNLFTAVNGAQFISSGAQSTTEQTLLFRNSYYTNNTTAGVAAIGWIDTGSSGGILTFKTGVNGGGVTNIPTEKMRIDNAGNVGIGASSPGAKLHTLGFTDAILLKVEQQKNDGGSTDMVLLRDDRGFAGINSGTSLHIQSWSTGNDTGDIFLTERFTGGSAYPLRVKIDGTVIMNDGNVGIGTPSPSAKTHIVGSDILYGENSADAVNRPTISLGWNSTTQARLGLTYFSGAPTLGWSLETRNAGASVAAVTITGAGNVGIGTTSPLALRTLNLEIGPQGTNDGAAVIINKKGTGISTLRLATQGAASGFDLNFNFPTTGYLGIYDIAAAAHRLVIDTTGNVGIGTASPTARFEVANNTTSAEARISSTANVYSYLYLNTWALDRAQLRAEAANPGSGSGTGSGILSFWTAGNPTMTERMRIDGSGNVGIGTSSPSTEAANARLAVVGTATQYASTLATSNSNALASFRGWSSTSYSLAIGSVVTSGFPYIQGVTFNGGSASADLILQGYGGNVGIGTASPGTKLHVVGTVMIDQVSGEANLYMGSSTSGNSGRITYDNNNTNFKFLLGGSEKMRLDNDNNLKVGGSAARATTAGTNQVVIFNGTAPVGTLANGCSFFSTAGEMRVMDAAGNWTQISPHDRKTNEWIYNSVHTPSGKGLKINVEKLLRFVNDHFGLDCVHDLIEEA